MRPEPCGQEWADGDERNNLNPRPTLCPQHSNNQPVFDVVLCPNPQYSSLIFRDSFLLARPFERGSRQPLLLRHVCDEARITSKEGRPGGIEMGRRRLAGWRAHPLIACPAIDTEWNTRLMSQIQLLYVLTHLCRTLPLLWLSQNYLWCRALQFAKPKRKS